LHSFFQKSVIFYVKQVAFAVAVRAAETVYWFAVCADGFGGFAFFSFRGFFEEHFKNFYGAAVKKVINVPKLSFLASKMPFYSLLQISLCGANVSV
jgi:hypothetical protein